MVNEKKEYAAGYEFTDSNGSSMRINITHIIESCTLLDFNHKTGLVEEINCVLFIGFDEEREAYFSASILDSDFIIQNIRKEDFIKDGGVIISLGRRHRLTRELFNFAT